MVIRPRRRKRQLSKGRCSGRTLETEYARQFVTIMRKLCDDFYTKCRAKGPEAAEKFDKVYKMQIMPEYMIPYDYQLLAMRCDAMRRAA